VKEKNALLRNLPKIDDVMRLMAETMDVPERIVKRVAQEQIDKKRNAILAGESPNASPEDVIEAIRTQIAKEMQPSLRSVINATGTVLHTNLGRAKLPAHVMEALSAVAMEYSNLEYDLESGQRGSRYEHVEALLTQLTGAEAALVVNNNAAALYLILDTMAKGREVVVSRGELVEIGGSFRIPNIMEQSGCHLKEVGTTNKTHTSDYLNVLGENTAALMKVHTSNYRIIGFTEEVSLSDLWNMGQENHIPVIYDLGSGLFMDMKAYGITNEPTVSECVPFADILCFSGDKLLGGPQAGIIVGSKAYIDQMKKNHLLRALRIDKLTLSALEYTLRLYQDPKKAMQDIPTLRMITVPQADMLNRANQLKAQLRDAGLFYEVVETDSKIGGGAFPEVKLPSYAISIGSNVLSADAIETRLRESTVPIIARISQNRVLLDMRTIEDQQLSILATHLNQISISLL